MKLTLFSLFSHRDAYAKDPSSVLEWQQRFVNQTEMQFPHTFSLFLHSKNFVDAFMSNGYYLNENAISFKF